MVVGTAAFWAGTSNAANICQLGSTMVSMGGVWGPTLPAAKLQAVDCWLKQVEELLKGMTPEQDDQLRALENASAKSVEMLRETYDQCKSDLTVITLQYMDEPIYCWLKTEGVYERVTTLFEKAGVLRKDTLTTTATLNDGMNKLKSREAKIREAATAPKRKQDAPTLKGSLKKIRRWFKSQSNGHGVVEDMIELSDAADIRVMNVQRAEISSCLAPAISPVAHVDSLTSSMFESVM
ncbi:hypothetical protein OF83DRAFT_1178012 [Amylostereum chailletii]|nr:hypothetical protein OF83DRAFT_1178012 [Amylostereum chailletii]